MAVQILLVLVGVMLIGGLLLIWGWRGRRLNDHPICRQCGFDLSGTLPGGVTCPECGSGVKRAKAVRIGQRRRRVWAVLLGLLLVLGPAGLLGLSAAAMLVGADLNTYKPVGLLMWEAGHRGDAVSCEAAGGEVLKRYTMGKWGDERTSGVIDTVLDIQGDRARHWSDALGELVGTADVRRQVSAEQMARYLRQAPVLDIETRNMVSTGGVLPVFVRLVETRLGPGDNCVADVTLVSAALGGRPLEIVERNHHSGVPARIGDDDEQYIGNLWFSRPAAGARSFGLESNKFTGCVFALPDSFDRQEQLFEVSVRVTVKKRDLFGKQRLTSVGFREAAEQRQRLRERQSVVLSKKSQINTLPSGVGPVSPSLDIKEDIATNRFFVSGITVKDWGGEQHASISVLDSDQGSFDYAFDVFLTVDGQKWKVGRMASSDIVIKPKFQSHTISDSGNQTPRISITGTISGFSSERADVILRPSSEAAERTADIEQFYGKQIIYQDQDVNVISDTNQKPTIYRNRPPPKDADEQRAKPDGDSVQP